MGDLGQEPIERGLWKDRYTRFSSFYVMLDCIFCGPYLQNSDCSYLKRSIKDGYNRDRCNYGLNQDVPSRVG